MTLVTENYTADCMSYHVIVNPNQFQYYVKGYQRTLAENTPLPPQVNDAPPSRVRSDKPVGKHVDGSTSKFNKKKPYHQIQEAPIVESAPSSTKIFRADVPFNKKISELAFRQCENIAEDALDQAIREAKAVKDLVYLQRFILIFFWLTSALATGFRGRRKLTFKHG